MRDIDPEFVFAEAGGDVGMRGGVDVGIHAQRHARLHAAAGGQCIDQRQLGFRFAIEAADIVLERVVDFLRGFPTPEKTTLRGIAAGFENAEQFAAGDDVESRAGIREQPQDRQIAVGFYGVADLVRHRTEGLIVRLETLEDRAARVDVAGRAFAARRCRPAERLRSTALWSRYCINEP